ncbi:TolC family protein [uncultured Pontibacter sp.]|uniref:TolC family protein n=1 Tax=uncultured Pontibacter sp. TaxID=453356 RepID=UPI00261083C7|nr:TolC family protein [uncultured Pontibacter sp.]
MRSRIFILCLLASLLVWQPYTQAQVLTLQEYQRVILANHPVASQARLLTEQARQELRIARGVFDPELVSKLYRKEFNGKEYYNTWDNTLYVPLWFGPVLKAGFEKNGGQYLNPEKGTPADGLSYAGISVPLGQGLFIDERRSTLRQAQLMQDIAEAERVKLINKLLLEATKDYWDWLLQYRTMQLYQEALELADFRLRAVNIRAQEGDLAAIDTVEARMAVQDRQVLLEQAKLNYNNTRLRVAVHLWAENEVPLELQENTIPTLAGSELATMHRDSLDQLLQFARRNHPDLLKLDLKGSQLAIEQRFAADKLKPKLNVDYNVLQSDFYLDSEALDQQYMGNNYKLGVSLSLPLFLRQERGKLQLTKAKQQVNALELTQTSREIEASVVAAYNEWLALEQQIRLQEQAVANALILRNGEVTRFENGESSLFLINSREVKLLESQVKLYELRTKYAKSKTYLYWSAGSMEE